MTDPPKGSAGESRLIAALGARLERRGWQASAARPARLTRDARLEIEWQINLNVRIAAALGNIRMEPALGVRHREISRLSALFLGLPASLPATSPSVGVNLSELLPDPNDIFRWSVFPEQNEQEIEDRMISDIEEYGAPFFVSAFRDHFPLC
ncbi:hypothetical protein AB0C74_35800 [Spirillospora sp. NPDC048832]